MKHIIAIATALGVYAAAQAREHADLTERVTGVVQYTTDVLFRELWLRPDLAPRDRSLGSELITIEACCEG